MTEAFRERQRRTVAAAQAVARELLQAGEGVNVLTGGTDVHLVLVDLRECALDGQQAEDRLHDIGITVNRNAVPVRPAPADGHERPARRHARRWPPAACRRDDFEEVGRIIAAALTPDFDARRDELAERVTAIVDRYPLYEHLKAGAPV